MTTFTTDDGVTLSYQDSGGEGIPLVMLPGWGQTQAMFRHQLSELGAHRRVITHDHLGHGRSEKPHHGYRIARLALDFDEFVGVLRRRDPLDPGVRGGATVVRPRCAGLARHPAADRRPDAGDRLRASHVSPDSQRYITDRIPDARLHVFLIAEASSHFIFLQNPAAFNSVVEDFLR